MEKTPPNSSSSQDKVKNHLIENRNEEPSCSSSSSETKANTSTEQSGSKTEKNGPEVNIISIASTDRYSPDPSCAICLEPLQNKSFTDSCLHMFCFKCLVAWSKIKPECPLCKQQFKSIIHNVQENFQYDTYHIRNRSTETYWNLINTRDHLYGTSNSTTIQATSSEPRFRYRTTLTSDRLSSRNHPLRQDSSSALRTSLQMGALRLQIESHRMRFAPHSVSVISTSQSTDRRPSTFRRRVYRQNLWVKCERGLERVRVVTPEFFNRNPACTHRLIPWLNRELIVLLHNNESQIVYVLELIMALITRYDINSPEFFMHIQPYIRKRTNHFIHEFYNFASSPFEMDDYDGHVVYETLHQNPAHSPVTDSSSDGELIDVESVEVSTSIPSIPRIDGKISRVNNTISRIDNLGASNSSAANTALKQSNSSRTNQATKVVLKRNLETNSWVTVTRQMPRIQNYNNINHYYSNPGPSTSSGFSTRSISLYDAPSMSISPLRVPSSDDECQIVEEVKSKKEKTPEIIDLSSDEEAPPIVDISSPENNDFAFGHLDSDSSDNGYSPFNPSPFRKSDSSSSIECVYAYKPLTPPNEEITMNHIRSPERNSPIDLSSRKSPKINVSYTSVIKETSAFNSTLRRSSIPIDLSEQVSTSKRPVNVKESLDQETTNFSGDVRLSVPSKIVVPNLSTNQSNSYWNAPSSSRQCSGPYFDNSSTESCSDSSPKKPPKKRKLKLKSVVAHFSFDKSDEKTDSSRKLSHKKRKEKKKKKKKRSRKHKYRIYSDSDSESSF